LLLSYARHSTSPSQQSQMPSPLTLQYLTLTQHLNHLRSYPATVGSKHARSTMVA
jgi:hypothetical protein